MVTHSLLLTLIFMTLYLHEFPWWSHLAIVVGAILTAMIEAIIKEWNKE